ncbi:hypothetical protein [Sulfuriflexus mobilis]|uniref:hypothetical protein n=1 Tax=Sulfuriflexus mobilis TaxID=1811807 RepID=UPI000F82A391|nr:hypothetical protein [Sulfuriflexus mobilis]
MKRPLSITLIAWFFIVYAVLSLIPKLILFISPEAYDMAKDYSALHKSNEILSIPFWAQILHACLGSVVLAISGLFMLKGKAWARTTLVVWILSVVIITFLVAGLTLQLYTKSVVAIIIFLMLYWPGANKYFKVN